MKHTFAPDTITRPTKPRCCAKCRTPYMCGNQDCGCHQKPKESK